MCFHAGPFDYSTDQDGVCCYGLTEVDCGGGYVCSASSQCEPGNSNNGQPMNCCVR